MFSDFNIRVTFFLFVTTILALGAHKLGLMNTSFDITDGSHNIYVTTVSEGNAIDTTDKGVSLSSSCTLSVRAVEFSMCGISIAIGDEVTDNTVDLAKGYDLSVYDSIEIELKYTSPAQLDRVRVSLRNYNEEYSKPNDFVSLKFNSVIFTPNIEASSQHIPFGVFHVKDWWIRSKNLSFSQSLVDFTNVRFIELLSDEMLEVGDYNIVVNKVIFHGQLVDELGLLQIISVMWLLAVIFLVARQAKNLKIISNTDVLTGLLNRRGISTWSYKQGTNLQNRRKGFLFYFDIDGFKKVNDTHGHAIGDDLLIELGNIVNSIVLNDPKMQSNVGFSRLAGDEFVLIISRIDKLSAERIANEILEKLTSPIVISNRLIKVGISMGITAFKPNVDDFEDTLSRADSAMYCAKQDGKNRFRFFDDHVRDVIYRRKQIAESIRVAADNKQFYMVYMPIFRTADLYINKVEVLLRCNAQELEGVGPDQFIPIAEEFGVIQNIDLLVIETTFKHIYRNREVFEKSKIKVCINISAKELHNVSFTESLQSLLDVYRINSSQIELEITETSLVEIDEQSIKILNQIRELGISLALDDFGTGYTAFSQIVNYPIDCLKIDKTFIDDLTSNNEIKKTMVKSILAIAKSFKLETVAEGIEKDEQFNILKDYGCDAIQGYLLSKPISWFHFKSLLEDQDGRGNIIKVSN